MPGFGLGRSRVPIARIADNWIYRILVARGVRFSLYKQFDFRFDITPA